MSLHQDLLSQAEDLAKRESKRPKQASLRRSVSSAYYAVFHLLIDAASRFVIRGDRVSLRHTVARSFDHGEMKHAANTFRSGTLPSVLLRAVPEPIPVELKRLCRNFIDLQQARHEADYDLARTFTRRDALELTRRAHQSFQAWQTVAGSQAGEAFLVALLLRRKLER